MTENEAIERLGNCRGCMHLVGDECLGDKACFEAKEYAIKALYEIKEYRSIGTVSECREAMEKQRAKKPVKDEYNRDCCPDCGWIVYQDEWGGRYLPHCENCGQAILWERDTP